MYQKLDQNGCIPAHTECPFKSECPLAIPEPGLPDLTSCLHQGVQHNVAFSCAMARTFEIVPGF